MARRRSRGNGLGAIEATVAVGKNGITDSVVKEIRKQLKNRKTIKVKLHGESKLRRLETAKELAERSESRLLDLRGFTVVLTRKRKRL